MADWEVALDKQIDTWLFLNSPKGDAYLDAYIEDVKRSYPWEVEGWRRMGETARQTLWEAEPIYVTSEMMSLLEAAWPQFQREPLNEEEIIIPTGFLYLPRPVHINDVHGKDFGWRAVAWRRTLFSHPGEENKPGVMVTFFSHPGDKDGYWDAAQAQGREGYFGSALALAHQIPLIFGEDGSFTDRMLQATEAYKAEGGGVGVRHVEESEVKRATADIFQFCQALWRLMGQRVAVGMRQRPGRAARHRAERAEYPDTKYITVVTLRRPRAEGSGDSRAVDWHQRWIVSGHWRWQPYGDGTHRQIWIAPYVKGPEDKPLVIRGARVFRLAR